jgi:hypothetical protein
VRAGLETGSQFLRNGARNSKSICIPTYGNEAVPYRTLTYVFVAVQVFEARHHASSRVQGRPVASNGEANIDFHR